MNNARSLANLVAFNWNTWISEHRPQEEVLDSRNEDLGTLYDLDLPPDIHERVRERLDELRTELGD
jgi:hypothetical protein